MTIRLILPTTPTMHRSIRRIIPGNRDLLNHILLPSMYRTILRIPITTRLMVPLLTPFRIRLRLSGMARLGPSLANQSHRHQHHPSPTHPLPLLLIDQNLHLHLQHQHQHPPLHPHLQRPHSACMRLPHNHNPTRSCGAARELLKPQSPLLLSKSVNRGRKRLPLLGIHHR